MDSSHKSKIPLKEDMDDDVYDHIMQRNLDLYTALVKLKLLMAEREVPLEILIKATNIFESVGL